MRGMHDDKHYNYWEKWFQQAFKVEEFSAINTLWLSYFIAGGSVGYKQQKFAFKKILQTVYTSLPDIIGILFLARKYTLSIFSLKIWVFFKRLLIQI